MEHAVKEQNQKIHMIVKQFDQILAGHLERLLGSREGLGGLPLNLMTVSCLIFLAGQKENERHDFSTSTERYTHETLFREIEEIGLGSSNMFKEVMAVLLEKQYIRIDGTGHISSEKTVLETSRIINDIFPKMPGLNFIAYVAQTINETISGRKQIDEAISQFDQTLLLQGVPIIRDGDPSGKKLKIALASKTGLFKSRPVYDSGIKRTAGGNLISAGEYQRIRQGENQGADSASTGRKIISSNGGFQQADIKEISFGKTVSNRDETNLCPPDADEQPNTEVEESPVKSQVSEENAEIGTGNSYAAADGASDSQDLKEPDSDFQDGDAKEEIIFSKSASEREPKAPQTDVTPYDSREIINKQPGLTETAPENDFETGDRATDNVDVTIERKIFLFEEDLALQCPLCKSVKIVAERTMKGKTYYKCPRNNCNFISWGKPHHYECPRCNNPFLIESERNGETVLKCPRATCRYWQAKIEGNMAPLDTAIGIHDKMTKRPVSKPRRRVVKRRVVRKKR